MNIFLSFLSGILGFLSFPKYDISFLVWIAFIPFFYVLYSTKYFRSALLYGFIFGITYFGGIFFWVTSLTRWVGFWGNAAWIMLALYQTLYLVFFSYLVFISSKYFPKYVQLFFIPALWVGVEWFRSFGEFAVPGGHIGYTQYQNLPLIQISKFISVFGISYLIILVNILLVIFITSKGRFIRKIIDLKYLIAIVIVVLTAVYAFGIDALNQNKKEGEILKLALIQPNIDQAVKLDPRSLHQMINLFVQMSNKTHLSKPDIIIWPETAITSFIEQDPAVFSKIKEAAVYNNCYLVTGGFSQSKGRLYNSLFSISPQGQIISRYDKEHLMPFGEYLPFRNMLYPFLKGTKYFEQDESPNPNPVILKSGKYKIGAMICFESLFTDIAYARAKKADFLLTVTNDAWFGESAGAYQHVMAAPFRAIENRKYFVQVANTGISAIVDPWGRFLKKSKVNERKVVIGEIRAR